MVGGAAEGVAALCASGASYDAGAFELEEDVGEVFFGDVLFFGDGDCADGFLGIILGGEVYECAGGVFAAC